MTDINQVSEEAPTKSMLAGWRGFWMGILAAVLAEYAYGAAVMVSFMISPDLLHFWNFGGFWEKAAFALPIWIGIATAAIWTYRRARFFSRGMIAYLAVTTTGFAIYVLFFVPGFGL